MPALKRPDVLMKHLTPANLFERDARMDHWSIHGLGFLNHPNEQWVAWILEIELADSVPDQIAEMLERVKAVAAYATCYYPLFAVAADELFRVQDAALCVACQRLEAPKSKTGTYEKRIAWAVGHGLIAPDNAPRWQAARQLRNYGAHRTKPGLIGPNDLLGSLRTASRFIGSLFDRLEGQ